LASTPCLPSSKAGENADPEVACQRRLTNPILSSEASGGTMCHGSVIPKKERKSVDNPVDRHRNVTDTMAKARNA